MCSQNSGCGKSFFRAHLSKFVIKFWTGHVLSAFATSVEDAIGSDMFDVGVVCKSRTIFIIRVSGDAHENQVAAMSWPIRLSARVGLSYS